MSNLPQPIKSQLKGLKQVTLSAGVKEQQKAALLAEIGVAQETTKKEFFVKELFSVYVREWTASMTWRSIGAMFLLFGIVIGPGIATVSASRGSLPGDALFPVKRGIEKAKISVTFTNKAKAKLEIDHVENRVHELARLTKEQAPSPERTVKVFMALEELKKDTASVKGRIEKLKDDSKNDTSGNKKKDATEVALLVQEKTVSVQESIKTTVKDLATEGDAEAHADVKEALDSVNEVAIDALEVIVESHEEDETAVPEEEVKELVKKQLENTKEIVEVLKEEVAEESEETIDEDVESQESTEDEPEEPAEEEEVAEEASTEEEAVEESEEEKTEEQESEEATEEEVKEEVKKIIEEDLSEDIEIIEQLIEMDNLSQAVDKLAEAKSQVSEINKDLKETAEKAEETTKEEATEEPVEEEASEEGLESEEEPTETEQSDEEDANQEVEEKQLIDVIDAE